MSVSLYTPSSSKIIHDARVDFRQRVIQPIIHIVQYDKSLPILAVKLYNNGVEYQLPQDADISIRFGKRDHTFVYNATLGCNADRTIVYFELTEQMTVFYGEHNPIIELKSGDNVAGSGSIPIHIDRNPIQEGDIESSVESGVIEDLIKNLDFSNILQDTRIGMVINLLTNINGRALNNYTLDTSTLVGNYPYINVKFQNNPITEAQAKTYLKHILGSSYLPIYDYNFPNNHYVIDADGNVWKPQWTDIGGNIYQLRMYVLNKTVLLRSNPEENCLLIYKEGKWQVITKEALLGSIDFSNIKKDVVLKSTDVAVEYGQKYDSHSVVLKGDSWEFSDNENFGYVQSSDSMLSTPHDLFFSNDGLKLFVLDSNHKPDGVTTQRGVYQCNLTSPFDIMSRSDIQKEYIISDYDNTIPYGLFFKPDGLSLYYVGSTSRKVFQVNLTIAWDLSSASTRKESSQLINKTYQDIHISSDGTKAFITESSDDIIRVYDIGTPWDISTMSATNSQQINIKNDEPDPYALTFNPDGTKMVLIGKTSGLIIEYTVNPAWSTNIIKTGYTLPLVQAMSTGIRFNSDGTKIFIIGTTTRKVDEFALDIPYSLQGLPETSKEREESFHLRTETEAGQDLGKLVFSYQKDNGPKEDILKIDKFGNIGDYIRRDYVDNKMDNAYIQLASKEFVDTSHMKNVSYSELVELRNNSQLIPGTLYRIIDYETITAQVGTSSAGNLFDIIVVAVDKQTFSEEAYAIHSERDINGYFTNSKLESWKIWYCLDNDTSRFAWADEVNGKGVIYRMIDEFHNDVPYDFKNIQFLKNSVYYYTFSAFENTTQENKDASLMKSRAADDDFNGMTNNVIKPRYDYLEDGDNLLSPQKLNNIIFKTYYDEENYVIYLPWNNSFGVGCYNIFFDGTEFTHSNTFGSNCTSNTFGNGCSANTFDSNCSSNTFGNYCNSNTFGYGCFANTFDSNCFSNTFVNYCNSNTFGNGCNSNTFANDCSYNTFGYGCFYNTFGNNCHSNTFGNNCYSNTFGNDCGSNTFGNSCGSNTFGDYCNSNTFGYGCFSNTFGNNCHSNTFGNNCYSNTFGNNCRYLQISDVSSTQKQYIHVENGTYGASSANKLDLYDPAILNKNYQVTFKKSASGKYLMLWATDTGTMTGKVKDSNIDTTWEDIA